MFAALKDRYKKWLFKKSFIHAVREANEMRKETGARHFVLFVEGKFRAYNRHVLKKLISKRYFVKGVTIEELESKSAYVTP